MGTPADPVTPEGSDDAEWRQSAHDIKNILASISLVADELTATETGRGRVLGQRLDRSCRRILEICRVPRPDRGAAPVPLSTVLGDVADIATGLCAPHVRVNVAGQMPHVAPRCAEALFRILANLATNAVAAMHGRGGRLDIVSRTEARHLVIDVADTGPGLGAPPTGPGTGLPPRTGQGLRIARRLSDEIGGSCALVTTGPRGTTFRIRVPLDAGRRPAAPAPGGIRNDPARPRKSAPVPGAMPGISARTRGAPTHEDDP